jgi:hypothetical protein
MDMTKSKSPKRLTKKSALIVLIFFLAVFAVALMLLHKIPDNYHRRILGENYQIIGPFWIVLNYDSREFMRGAENLNNILAPGYVRQSRPGTVFIAYFISKILAPVLSWIENTLAATGREFHPPLERYLHQYVAYVLINVAAVVTSFWLYLKHVGGKKTVSIAATAAAALLLLNNIGKAFLLTPHTAILELLVPLVAMDMYLRVRRADSIKRSGLIPYSVILGLVAIAYTGILIAGPAVVVAEFLNRRDDAGKKGWSRVPWWGALSTTVMLLPIAAWMIFIATRNDGFYAAEFAGTELVWLGEAVRENAFQALVLLGSKIGTLAWMALKQTWPLLMVIVAALVAAGPKAVRRLVKREARGDLPLGAIIVSTLSILFFALIGLTIPRRAYMAVPPLIVLLGWFLENLSDGLPDEKQTRLSITITAAIAVSAIIFFLQQGPYW